MGAVPRLCEFYPGICLKNQEKARKNPHSGLPKSAYKNLTEYQVQILYQRSCLESKVNRIRTHHEGV
jgi:hypothetical protein